MKHLLTHLIAFMIVLASYVTRRKRTAALHSHSSYMQTEYGDLYREQMIENWIDYVEGYITG